MKCVKSEARSTKLISKVMTESNFSEISEYYAKIRRLDPKQKYTLTYTKYCELEDSDLTVTDIHDVGKCDLYEDGLEKGETFLNIQFPNGGKDLEMSDELTKIANIRSESAKHEKIMLVMRNLADLITFCVKLNRSGIYHCDIKPANILIDNDLRFRLIDFDLIIDLDNINHIDNTGTPTHPEVYSSGYIYYPPYFDLLYRENLRRFNSNPVQTYRTIFVKHFFDSESSSVRRHSTNLMLKQNDPEKEITEENVNELKKWIATTPDYKFRILSTIDVYSMAIIIRYVMFRLLGGDQDLRANLAKLIVDNKKDVKLYTFFVNLIHITDPCLDLAHHVPSMSKFARQFADEIERFSYGY